MSYPHHVLVDVTRAQAGEPAVIADVPDEPIEVGQALLLSDDLRRAALTADQLHDEHGDARDPNRREATRAQGELDIAPIGGAA